MEIARPTRATCFDPHLVGATRRRLRVLLVEDDVELNAALHARLAFSGMRVQSVRDAEGALEAIERRRPDVLLLDLGLPDQHGLDLMADLLERGEHCPVVVLTGAADRDCRLARVAGAERVLQKPSPSWMVVDAVREACEQ